MRDEETPIFDTVRIINDTLNIPVIFNGGIKCLKDVDDAHTKTGCRGFMAGGGLLKNPGLFSSASEQTKEQQIQILKDYLELNKQYPVSLKCTIQFNLFSLLNYFIMSLQIYF